MKLTRSKRKSLIEGLSALSSGKDRNRQKRHRHQAVAKPPPPVTVQHPIVWWHSTVDLVEEGHRRRLRAALKAAGRTS